MANQIVVYCIPQDHTKPCHIKVWDGEKWLEVLELAKWMTNG